MQKDAQFGIQCRTVQNLWVGVLDHSENFRHSFGSLFR